jgi:hypothetical protein
LLLLATGCGGEAKRAPDVTGERLDVAQETLDDAGLEYEVIGGGALGVVVRSNWYVCEQHPRPGGRAKSVELIVARSCAAQSPAGVVPDVTGLALDEAKRSLARRGLEAHVYEEGVGDVVVESNWSVCDQWPYSGESARAVDLYVEQSCDDFDLDDDDDDF